MNILKPTVDIFPGPLKPQQMLPQEQSVLLGRSFYMYTGDGQSAGEGEVQPPFYEPIQAGGFRIAGSRRRLNRPIVHGQNRVWTGDLPIFRMDTVTGNGTYVSERVFPLWDRPDAAAGNVTPSMGTLRLGVPDANGATQWFDERGDVATTFLPGYTSYEIADKAGWHAAITIAPALDFHGMVCRVEFDVPTQLAWQCGGIWWTKAEKNSNSVAIDGAVGTIEEPNLPNGLVAVGTDAPGRLSAFAADYGEGIEFGGSEPQRVFHICVSWGVTAYDEARAQATLDRLDTPAAAAWGEERALLGRLWFDAYIGRALQPRRNLAALLEAPETRLRETRAWWDARRAEFQIETPDARLDALINWSRCISEHHRQGPGLVLGGQIWQKYSHLSTGWYGKSWGGDHEAIDECLRLYAAMMHDDGIIRWIAPSLYTLFAEDNNPYWIDQVWQHVRWTGDAKFAADMWPLVRKALAWKLAEHDPDGDGLFRSHYEYWNGDSNGKGPKAAAPTAMAWAMLTSAAGLAHFVGAETAALEYEALADKTKAAVERELWRAEAGRLGSIGADGMWRGHAPLWEQFLAINCGLLDPERGRGAMRWLASHYGFSPYEGVHLLMCSDLWPIRWSVQWIPTGDTCLAAMAGMKCGDTDLWWPYLQTVIGSAFRSEFPGVNMGIANSGAGGGDREDVDSSDPHLQMAVRGLFGIEPNLHDGSIDIRPAFPSDWTRAAIVTPDISYRYEREGDRATFHISSERPLAKRVRANYNGAELTTPIERESVVTLELGPAVAPPPLPTHPPTILAEQEPVAPPIPLSEEDRSQLTMVDLDQAFNITCEELMDLEFVFDYCDHTSKLVNWWGNPRLSMPPAPKLLETPLGVDFLTAGRPQSAEAPPKNLLALSSWAPYPLPGAAIIPIGMRCCRVFLLLQCYVHPIKNYIPNGEIVLHYSEGDSAITSLVPPFNLDCYFQHFSRESVAVPFGTLEKKEAAWHFVPPELSLAHADVLEIAVDSMRTLRSIELRATCSEGVLGLAGLSVVANDS